MALITPNEAVAESVKRSLDLHEQRLHESVGRILSKRPRNRATLSGSGIFIRVRGADYFLTAGHVLVDKGDDALLTATDQVGVSINEVVHSYSKDPDDPEDLLDAGLFVVTDKMKSHLGAITPLEVDRSISRGGYPLGHIFAVVGYPRSKNKKPLADTPLPPAKRNVLVTGLKDHQHLTNRPAVRPNIHLVLGWSNRKNVDRQGRPVTVGALAGMSGGAIFDLGDHSDLAIMNSKDKPLPVLAGIFTRYIESEEALLGTRLSAICDVLDKEDKWPS